jgi:hypothetical protein
VRLLQQVNPALTVGLLVGVLLVPAPGVSHAVLMNFDDVVGSQVDITNRYVALGVTLNTIDNPFPLAGPFPAPATLATIRGGATTWTDGFASATSPTPGRRGGPDGRDRRSRRRRHPDQLRVRRDAIDDLEFTRAGSAPSPTPSRSSALLLLVLVSLGAASYTEVGRTPQGARRVRASCLSA